MSDYTHYKLCFADKRQHTRKNLEILNTFRPTITFYDPNDKEYIKWFMKESKRTGLTLEVTNGCSLPDLETQGGGLVSFLVEITQQKLRDTTLQVKGISEYGNGLDFLVRNGRIRITGYDYILPRRTKTEWITPTFIQDERPGVETIVSGVKVEGIIIKPLDWQAEHQEQLRLKKIESVTKRFFDHVTFSDIAQLPADRLEEFFSMLDNFFKQNNQ